MATELPELNYDKWIDTRITIHLIFQIIGKSKLSYTPRKNHWWYITIHPSSRGFSTYNIPLNDGMDVLDIHFDIEEQSVLLESSDGTSIDLDLSSSPTVADFYTSYMTALAGFGLEPKFIKKPLDMDVTTPFDEITNYHHYDWDAIKEFWKAMTWSKNVFQEYSGRFYGQTCPVHIYWHSFDLAVTRFSGKKLPATGSKEGRLLERDTYSHEQISSGFWAGDSKVPQPMYYSYTFPAPEGLNEETLEPSEANWIDSNGSPMAVLSYETVRTSENPRKTLLQFLESSYQAGAKRSGWDIEIFKTPPLSEI